MRIDTVKFAKELGISLGSLLSTHTVGNCILHLFDKGPSISHVPLTRAFKLCVGLLNVLHFQCPFNDEKILLPY